MAKKKSGLAAILAREKQNEKIIQREKYAVQKQQQMKENAKAKRRKQSAPASVPAPPPAVSSDNVSTESAITTTAAEGECDTVDADPSGSLPITTQTTAPASDMIPALTQKQKQSFVIPFEPTDHVLLVGEGDFSFAVSILKQNLVKTLTPTSLDDEKTVAIKYPDTGPANIEFLRTFDGTAKRPTNGASDEDINGGLDDDDDDDNTDYKFQDFLPKAKPWNCSPLFGIDGTKLNTLKPIRQSLRPIPKNFFDVILFNFPHTGSGIKDQDRNVLQHQKLMDAFFKASRPLMRPRTGSIVVSLFDGLPYSLWNLKILAKAYGLTVRRSANFDWTAFPGYYHRLTAGRGDTTKQAVSRSAKFYIFEAFEFSHRANMGADNKKKKKQQLQLLQMKGKKKKKALKQSHPSSDDDSD